MLILICMGITASPQVAWLGLSGSERALRKRPIMYTWSADACRAADAMLLPGETYYAWNDASFGYAITNRRAPAAGLWKTHMVGWPLSDWLTQRTLEDLEREPPELFIYWSPLEPADHPIARWALAHYDPLPEVSRANFPHGFMVRRGGALQRRLTNRTATTQKSSATDP